MFPGVIVSALLGAATAPADSTRGALETWERYRDAIRRNRPEAALHETDLATQAALADEDGRIPPGQRALLARAVAIPFEFLRFREEYGVPRISNLPELFDDFFPFQGGLDGFWDMVRVRWLYGFRDPLIVVLPDPGPEAAARSVYGRIAEDLRGRARRCYLPDPKLLRFVSPSQVLPEDLSRGFVVIAGTPADNPLLAETADRLPFEFRSEGLALAESPDTWSGAAAIAMTAPSLWNRRLALLALAADRAESLPPLLGHLSSPWDFALVRGERLLQAGWLDHGAEDWRGIRRLANLSATEPDWVVTETGRFNLCFFPGSRLLGQRSAVALGRERAFRKVEQRLGTRFPVRVTIRFFPDLPTLRAVTGRDTPLFVDGVAAEVFLVFDGPPEAMGSYPEALAALESAWGPGSRALLQGIALFASRDTLPVDLDGAAAASLRGRASAPLDPTSLLSAAESPLGDTSGDRLLLASFVGFLAGERGPGVLEKWYRRTSGEAPADAFRAVAGEPLHSAMARWATQLPGRTESAEGNIPSTVLEDFQERRNARAEEFLAAALAGERATPAAWTLAARTAFRLGRYEVALERARRAIAEHPAATDAAWAHLVAGRALALLDRGAEAIPHLEAAALLGGATRGPGPVARFWLQRLGAGADPDALLARLAAGAASDLESLRRDEALEQLQALLSIDPWDAQAHALLASVYEELDQPLSAVQSGETAVALLGGRTEAPPELPLSLGRAYVLRNRVFLRDNFRSIFEIYVNRLLEFWTSRTDYTPLPSLASFLGATDLDRAIDEFGKAMRSARSTAQEREAELLVEVTRRGREMISRYTTELVPLLDVRTLESTSSPRIQALPDADRIVEEHRVRSDQQRVISSLGYLENLVKDLDAMERDFSLAGVGSPEHQDIQRFDAQALLDDLEDVRRRAMVVGTRD